MNFINLSLELILGTSANLPSWSLQICVCSWKGTEPGLTLEDNLLQTCHITFCQQRAEEHLTLLLPKARPWKSSPPLPSDCSRSEAPFCDSSRCLQSYTFQTQELCRRLAPELLAQFSVKWNIWFALPALSRRTLFEETQLKFYYADFKMCFQVFWNISHFNAASFNKYLIIT